MLTKKQNNANRQFLLDAPTDIMDSRRIVKHKTSKQQTILRDVPDKIVAKYSSDYNIIHIDEIVRSKLMLDSYGPLTELRNKQKQIEKIIEAPQKLVERKKYLNQLDEIKRQIAGIENGDRLAIYSKRVEPLLENYKKYSGKIKTLSFDGADNVYDEETRNRLKVIDEFLSIAGEYVNIDILHVHDREEEECIGCGFSLVTIDVDENGNKCCPECRTEHSGLSMGKIDTDNLRLQSSSNSSDESIENFMRAFIRYQGLQTDIPPESLYDELEDYFLSIGRPSGEEIECCELNKYGWRGDTNPEMLLSALSAIGRTEYNDDVNYIGKVYWGWDLPNLMHLKDKLEDHYNKTQAVFHSIPIEERERTSSLGTQYRLMQHLLLLGHECYIEEFKIAKNPDSLRNHNRLWKMMCEGCNDPEIYYRGN